MKVSIEHSKEYKTFPIKICSFFLKKISKAIRHSSTNVVQQNLKVKKPYSAKCAGKTIADDEITYIFSCRLAWSEIDVCVLSLAVSGQPLRNDFSHGQNYLKVSVSIS